MAAGYEVLVKVVFRESKPIRPASNQGRAKHPIMCAALTNFIKYYIKSEKTILSILSQMIVSGFNQVCRYQTGRCVAFFVVKKDRQKVDWDTREC
jgi:hypothetical protein